MEKVFTIEWLDACPGNVHTFEAVLKISQKLCWSIGSKYLTVSIVGSYLFFCFFHNIVGALFLHIWLKNFMYCSCSVIFWSCVWSKNVTLLNSSWIEPCFLMKKLALRDNGVERSIFVNQSNINKPELYWSQIGIYIYENYFANLQLLWFNPTEQS